VALELPFRLWDPSRSIYSSHIFSPTHVYTILYLYLINFTILSTRHICLMSSGYHKYTIISHISPSTYSSSHQLTVLAYLTCYPYHPHLYHLTTFCQLLLVTDISYQISIEGGNLSQNFDSHFPNLCTPSDVW